MSEDARWQALSANLPGVLIITDEQGVIQSIVGNGMLLGSALVGRSALALVPEPERPALREVLRRVRVEGGSIEFEGHTVNPDGLERWWACRAGLVDGGSGVMTVAVDISQRHKDQEALREVEARYLQAQKMEAVGRLASGLAHDLNNVLAAVQGYADLLEIKRPEDEAVARCVGGVRRSTDRAALLTRKLLAFGRKSEQGESSSELVAQVQGSLDMLDSLLRHDIRLVVDLCPGPLVVPLDPAQIEQIVLNLVVNARDAMPDGGTLRVSVGQQDGRALLLVEDTGAGMSDDVLTRAVEPFFTTKAEGVGSGLGLPTVYWLVENAGGSIRIDSAPGRGTVVACALPQVHPPSSQDVVEAPQVLTSPSPVRVLLAEDHPVVREHVMEMLRRQGHTVFACADGLEAFHLATQERFRFDLLVTDMMMPGLKGAQLISRLLEHLPDLPVLMMSGYTEDAPLDVGATVQRFRFLAKPFKMDALLRAVSELLAADPATRPPSPPGG